MTETLLPANASAMEQALGAVVARISDVPVPLRAVWDPETCPVDLLPWLAWGLSVDDWDARWPVERRREVIAVAVDVHRHKGSVWAIRRALDAAGFPDAELVERFGWDNYDGLHAYDGTISFAAADHWAEYRINLPHPISIEQAGQVAAILASVAPARCHLRAIDYVRAANLYDGAIAYDGAYSHGVV